MTVLMLANRNICLVQGGLLGAFFQSTGKFRGIGLQKQSGTKFHQIGFSWDRRDTPKTPCCLPRRSCKNDMYQYDKDGLAKKVVTKAQKRASEKGGWYELSNRKTFYAPDGASLGDVVSTPRSINETLHTEMTGDHVYDETQGLSQYDHMQHNPDTYVVRPADAMAH